MVYSNRTFHGAAEPQRLLRTARQSASHTTHAAPAKYDFSITAHVLALFPFQYLHLPLSLRSITLCKTTIQDIFTSSPAPPHHDFHHHLHLSEIRRPNRCWTTVGSAYYLVDMHAAFVCLHCNHIKYSFSDILNSAPSVVTTATMASVTADDMTATEGQYKSFYDRTLDQVTKRNLVFNSARCSGLHTSLITASFRSHAQSRLGSDTLQAPESHLLQALSLSNKGCDMTTLFKKFSISAEKWTAEAPYKDSDYTKAMNTFVRARATEKGLSLNDLWKQHPKTGKPPTFRPNMPTQRPHS